MRMKRREVEVRLGDDCRHSGPPVAAGHRDAVDVGLKRTVEGADRLFDFGGGHVFALPAKGVADAVDEIEIAVRILAHEVAGSEPHVAFLDHVVQYFLFGFRGCRIAFEPLTGFGRILDDPADDFAWLVGFAFNAEALLVADRLLPLGVESHDLDWKTAGDEPWDAPD